MYLKLLFLIILSCLSSCGELFEPALQLSGFKTNSVVLSGSVVTGTTSSSSIVQALSCGEYEAYLFEVNDSGQKVGASIAQADILPNGQFNFIGNSSLSQRLDGETVKKLVIEISGCGESFGRYVTGRTHQDINQGTNLLSYMAGNISELSSIQGQKLSAFYDQIIAENDEAAAYSMIIADTGLSNAFQEMFGTSPTILFNTPPNILATSVPTNALEGESVPFTANITHWNPSYQSVVDWEISGLPVDVGHSANTTWSTNRNSQGSRTVTLTVGQDDGTGKVNRSLPFRQRTFVLNVANNFPPVAPVLTASAYSNTLLVNLDLATGSGLSECDSFDGFAISENPLLSSLSSSSFSGSCSDDGTQVIPYTLSMADGLKTLYLWTRDSAGNISATPSQVMITLDRTAPTLNFEATTWSKLNAGVAGGETVSLAWTAADVTSGLASITVEVNVSGSYTTLATLAGNATSTSWTAPSNTNISDALIRLIAVDNAGNSRTNTSNPITIDSTLPATPIVSRVSDAVSNNSSVQLQVNSCTDTAYILINESATAPTSGTGGWATCSPSTTYNHTVTGQGLHTIRVWARDSAGNISASAGTITMTYDTIAPTISSVSAQYAAVKGGDSQRINWSASDASGFSLALQYNLGAGWVNIVGGISNTGNYTWNYLPIINNNNVRVRITATDAAGNVSQDEASPFTIDSTPPTVNSLLLANGATTVNLPSILASLTFSDTFGTVTHVRLSEDSTFADTNWEPISNEVFLNLSMSPGTKTVYAWVRDEAGNVSASLSRGVRLEFGSAPVLRITGPSNAWDYTSGANFRISWSCSSTNGLSPEPISDISYTIDNGVTLVNIASNQTNNISATSGEYDWALPSALATTPFRILVTCKAESGASIERLSDVYQTGGVWNIWAGSLTARRDGVLAYGSSKLVLTGASTGAMDDKGNIFYTSAIDTTSADRNISALMKIDSVSGQIVRMAGEYNSNGASAGEDFTVPPLNTKKLSAASSSSSLILGTSLDRKEILFLNNSNPVKIYGITADSTVRLYSTFSAPAFRSKNYVYQGVFLTKGRILFYVDNHKIFKLDLRTPGNNPIQVIGDGTSAPTITDGAEALSQPIKSSGTSGTAYSCQDCSVVANASGTRVWVGGTYTNPAVMTGTNGWAQYDLNNADGKYYVTNQNFEALRSLTNSTASEFDDIIYSRGRNNGSSLYRFNPETGTTLTPISMTGANGLEGTFRMNLFSSKSHLYYLIDSQEIRMLSSDLSASTTIAGNNVNKFGDGLNHDEGDFNSPSDMDYDPTSGLLAVVQPANMRFYNLNDLNPQWFSSSASGAFTGLKVRKGGTSFSGKVAIASLNSYTINLTARTLGAGTTRISNGCASCSAYSTAFDYQLQGGIPDGTDRWDTGRFFGLGTGTSAVLSGTPLPHSNNNHYFHARSTTDEHSYIYELRPGHTAHKFAGKAGAAGYNPADHGLTPLNVQLSANVSYMYEHRSTGDIIFIDGHRIRRLSVGTEPLAPKVYDIASLNLAGDFSASTNFFNVVYDENSEISGIPGSGTFYYVRNAPNWQIRKWSTNNSTFSAATDVNLNLPGFTIVTNYKLAITSDGLLILDPRNSRIVRVTNP